MDNHSAKKPISFYEMLTDKDEVIHKILIPKLQRDYAQGRQEMASLRKRFLSSIFAVIDSDTEETLTLDFVFGQKEESVRTTFYPVDGQQRLTTLFLLHIYIGKRAGESTDFLKKFSYETRDSSRNFCQQLHEIPSKEYENIADYIQKQWWYTGLWKYDPTITAMINMLSDIDKHYRELLYTMMQFKEVWNRLIHKVNFWLLYLSDLKTTDELYIKMNSRGKPLTDFEHFKAMLDEYTYTKGELSNKIDTVWTKLLWRYRDTRQDFDRKRYMDNGLDTCFYNLLRFYLNIEGAKRGLIQHSIDDILELADAVLAFHKDPNIDYTQDEELKAKKERLKISRGIMERFSSILDFFSETDETGRYTHDPQTFFTQYIDSEYTEWTVSPDNMVIPEVVKVNIDYLKDTDILHLICKSSKMELKPTLYAEAFFQHISQQTPDFMDRLRILRNLVENAELHAESLKDNLLIVDELISNGGMDITDVNDEFTIKQKKQERVKLNWMASNNEHTPLLKLLENHWLFVGNLYILMNTDEYGNDTIDLVLLKRFGHLFHSMCNYEQVERALLCYGDYSPLKNNIKSYGGWNWRLWRKNIIGSDDNNTRTIVRNFIHNESDFSEKGLEIIISKFLENCKVYTWPYYMVKYACIRNSTYAKFRHKGGNYSFFKLNANGGGGKEKYWNPFNSALRALLGDGNTVDDSGGPMTLSHDYITAYAYGKTVSVDLPDGETICVTIPESADRNSTITPNSIKINILENHISIGWPNDETINIAIPQKEGFDTVDRVAFAKDVCDKIFNPNGQEQLFPKAPVESA